MQHMVQDTPLARAALGRLSPPPPAGKLKQKAKASPKKASRQVSAEEVRPVLTKQVDRRSVEGEIQRLLGVLREQAVTGQGQVLTHAPPRVEVPSPEASPRWWIFTGVIPTFDKK